MVAQSVIETVQGYLDALKRQGVPVEFAVLYGSFARGEQHEWSDIDLMVISPLFDAPKKSADVDLLWLATLDSDVRIEPVAIGAQQWREDDSIGLIEIARREGQIIQPH
ncbi:nucleotidyltransferase domain-containing protein [Magnetofaba australis]|uniref:nucleotidyltransferase domain-containing protein n=1 Tax=Magnetofaba australis TaxID=1472297 RepID=UPI000A19C8F0|nr:nucleotidyltransferase domain-containing protein [Magnetofaba australis]